MDPISVPDSFPSLFWGYTAIWLLIVLYVISLGRRVCRLEKSERSKE